ncbi:M23 family metallopeptidase [Burkholderia sp. TSV86]|uniref:M23 family metallopeptidase n=1 Tax=Burkholderia sp. TSV86 TaxID=1385594 RepID=UPI00075B08AC|nr:peptidase [Burkholderia sp. TSV86]
MAKPSLHTVSADETAHAAGSSASLPRPPAFKRKLSTASAIGALIAFGIAALPAVSKPPATSTRDAARAPQRVLADAPFPSAQRYVTAELEQIIDQRAASAGAQAGAAWPDLLGDALPAGAGFAPASRPAPSGVARPGLFAPLAEHHSELLGYDVGAFSLAVPAFTPATSGVRTGAIEQSLADTLNQIDLPPEVRIQIGDLIMNRVKAHASAQPGDYYRIAFDSAPNSGTSAAPDAADTPDAATPRRPHVVALDLRVAGRTFGMLWFKPPGATAGAYYAFDGQPLDAPSLVEPVVSTRISSYFGERIHPITQELQMHTGVDLVAPAGAPVDAAAAGVVSFIGTDPEGYGKYVVIDHPDRTSTYYAHLSAFAPGLEVGMPVAQGQRVGAVGSTGAATGPHLHFEVRIDDQPVDPLVALANAQHTLSAMQLDAFRRVASETRLRLAANDTRRPGLARVDAPLWSAFATGTTGASTLRAIFAAHYAAS